jgi:hypothetical protein
LRFLICDLYVAGRLSSITNQRSKIKNSTGSFQLDRLLDEGEAASAAHFFEVAAVNGEEAALRGAVFVDAAGGRAVAVLLEKGAFEKYLAAGSATVAVAAPQRERLDDLFVLEAYADEATELALHLSRTEPGVLDGSVALGGEPFLERAALRCATG